MPAAMKPEGSAPRAKLLVSIHDVSPLSLEASQSAVALVVAAGVAPRALTVLVIPRHEDRVSLDQHPATRDWLRAIAALGIPLVMHGYTHRMDGWSIGPRGLLWAHGFARGQGEFYRSSLADARRRLEAGRAVLLRAGLESALRGLVPPAWLLSPEALLAVKKVGFDFYERLDGIVLGERVLARRVIGLGSLTALEAVITSWYAGRQVRRAPADTRLVLHPADLERPSSARTLRALLGRLLEDHEPLNYLDYLEAQA